MRTLATLCVLLLAAAGCTRSNANRIGNLARSANPQVAMDGSGNGIAVWQEGGDIVARFFLLATGFGDGEGITDALENYKPDVAMSVDGSAIVTWVARLAAGDVLVKARRYSPGRGWESERILDRGPPSVLDLPAAEFDDPDGAKRYEPVGSALDPQCPQVAMDDAGNGVVVWARGGRVCAVSYSAGDWSAPIVIDEPPDDRVGVLPRIAMHPDGAALVTYSIYGDPANVVVEGPTPQFPTQTELDVRGVFVAEFDPARRSFFVPEVVTTDAWFPERADPDIAVDPSGMFMIVWLRGGVTGGIRSQTSSLHYRCYRAGTGFVNDPGEIFPDTAFDEQYQPRLGMDAQGNAIVAFDSNYFTVSAARYNAATARWSSFQAIAPDGGNERSRLPELAVAPDGTAYLSFGADLDEGLATGNIYDPGSSRWGEPAAIDNTVDGASTPRGDVATDGSGIAIAVWQRNDAIQAHVWRAPVAAFTHGSLAAGAPASFDGRSSQARSTNGEIVAWQWTFPDGEASGASVLHALPAGTHDVSLTVTDTYGLTHTTTRSVTVADGGGGGGETATLTIVFDGGGEGQVSGLDGELICRSTEGPQCSFALPRGTALTFTATPLDDFFFSHWRDCDASDGNMCTVTLNGDRTIHVSFE